MQVFRLKGDFQSLDPWIPFLFDWGARGLEEREGEVWAYFPQRVELPLEGEWLSLPDEDWLSAWKRDLRPVRAGPFWVMAPWHEAQPGLIPIVVEPGMAFGTGHHETTRLALRALARHLRPGMRVLDLGTGSGILAIAAAKLGGKALGVDIDPTVIPLAQENARKNGVEVGLKEGSLEDVEGPFDLIVANLFAELHQAFAPVYPSRLAPGGVLLLTGILRSKAWGVAQALREAGFALTEEAEGEWVLYAATPSV
ncbi:MAG: 50S ribosomal protein L11 methyltransferase [Thermaceae bacterium]